MTSNTFSIEILRRILFAVHHLPKDMPNYSKTINEFSKVEVSLSELQTTIENLEYLSQAAFSTDKQLLNEICEKSIGVVLISQQNAVLVAPNSVPELIDRENSFFTQSHQERCRRYITERCVQRLTVTMCNTMDFIHWLYIIQGCVNKKMFIVMQLLIKYKYLIYYLVK